MLQAPLKGALALLLASLPGGPHFVPSMVKHTGVAGICHRGNVFEDLVFQLSAG